MNKLGSVVRFIGVGFFIIACILGGTLGGLWVDNRINTKPVFVLLGLVLGLVVAFWGVYQMLVPLIKENSKDRK
jgi:F0F1-type ATP synthase assembly protein I